MKVAVKNSSQKVNRLSEKTKEQVEAEIKRAEEFAKEHPTNMFGDNNIRKVNIFKRVCKEYLEGKDLFTLEMENTNAGRDLEDDEDEEGLEENSYIDDIINWLHGDLDEEHFW